MAQRWRYHCTLSGAAIGGHVVQCGAAAEVCCVRTRRGGRGAVAPSKAHRTAFGRASEEGTAEHVSTRMRAGACASLHAKGAAGRGRERRQCFAPISVSQSDEPPRQLHALTEAVGVGRRRRAGLARELARRWGRLREDGRGRVAHAHRIWVPRGQRRRRAAAEHVLVEERAIALGVKRRLVGLGLGLRPAVRHVELRRRRGLDDSGAVLLKKAAEYARSGAAKCERSLAGANAAWQ
jgi:hypothetical protein